MSIAVFSLGLGIILMLVQLPMVIRLRGNDQMTTPLFALMLALSFAPPALSWLIFYVWLPELGAQPFTV